jgi:hypothetical protein
MLLVMMAGRRRERRGNSHSARYLFRGVVLSREEVFGRDKTQWEPVGYNACGICLYFPFEDAGMMVVVLRDAQAQAQAQVSY